MAVVVLITVISALAIISVVRGLDGGVKVLSEINMVLAGLLLLVILLVGPTGEILSTFVSGGVAYLKELIPLSMPFGREDANFSQGWTAFYWAWWISWSPFVGYVYCPSIPGQNSQGVHDLRYSDPNYTLHIMDGNFWRNRDQPGNSRCISTGWCGGTRN